MQNYNTVEKQYNEDGTIFKNYKVNLNDGSHFLCTTRHSKHRLPSNPRMDSRWWNSNR